MLNKFKLFFFIISSVLLVALIMSVVIINDTKSSLTIAQRLISEYKVNLDSAKRKITEQNQAIDEQKSQLTAKDETISEIIQELKYKDQDLLFKDEKINSLTMRLTLQDSQIVSLETQLSEKKAEISGLSTRLRSFQESNQQMVSNYSNMRNKILARGGSNTQDRQSFITPGDPQVTALVKEITGGFNASDNNKIWSDYKKMYDWIKRNVSYSSDTSIPVLPRDLSNDSITWRPEFWRTPAETIKDKSGDCEDIALLLNSMMLNYNNDRYTVWLITIAAESPELAGHMAVALPVAGGRLSILDPAGNFYTKMASGNLGSEPVAIAVNNWLAYWLKDMPGAFVNGVFNQVMAQTFNSTADFINWASQR